MWDSVFSKQAEQSDVGVFQPMCAVNEDEHAAKPNSSDRDG